MALFKATYDKDTGELRLTSNSAIVVHLLRTFWPVTRAQFVMQDHSRWYFRLDPEAAAVLLDDLRARYGTEGRVQYPGYLEDHEREAAQKLIKKLKAFLDGKMRGQKPTKWFNDGTNGLGALGANLPGIGFDANGRLCWSDENFNVGARISDETVVDWYGQMQGRSPIREVTENYVYGVIEQYEHNWRVPLDTDPGYRAHVRRFRQMLPVMPWGQLRRYVRHCLDEAGYDGPWPYDKGAFEGLGAWVARKHGSRERHVNTATSILDVSWFMQDAINAQQTAHFWLALEVALRNGVQETVPSWAPQRVAGANLAPFWDDPSWVTVRVFIPSYDPSGERYKHAFDISPEAIAEFKAVIAAFPDPVWKPTNVLYGAGPGQNPMAAADFERACSAAGLRT